MARHHGTERFTDRVEHYAKYRPSYPPEAIRYAVRCGMDTSAVVADIGSGTGILSELLLDHVHRLYGIEPNDALRRRKTVARL